MHTAPTRNRRTLTALTATALTAALCTGGFAGSALAAPTAPTVTSAAPDVVELTIAEASDLLGAKQTTSVALVDEYLARIAAYDLDNTSGTDLNAVIAINEDAKAQAAALDAERAAGHVRGPLHGVPIVVKDNIDLKGMATTNGAIAFATYKPKNDSTVVKKLQAAGAIIIAKTNLSEFAWSGSDAKSGLGGEVLNPYDTTKTSSGSSGGTAAAVAASFATAGLGTDTYGSIRNPSGNQSLVGVRPTHGLVSLAGVTAQIAPLDTVGPMTKSVEDAAIILDAIAGYDKNDPYTDDTIGQVPESYVSELSDTSLEGTKILYLTNSRFHGAGSSRTAELAEVDAIEEAALADFEAQGATVERVELTSTQLTSISGRGWVGFAKYLDEFFAENDAYWPKGLAAKAAPTNKLTTADYVADGQETPQIAPDAEWLLSTANVSDTTLANQQTREDNARAAWAALLDEYDADAVAFPNDALPASDVTEDPSGYSDSATNADLASGLGAPAIALPVGFTAAGLPVSLQLTGALYSEASLLSYAYDYEQATQKRVAPSTTPELVHETPVVTPPKSKAMSITVKATGSTKAGKKAGVAVKASRSGSAVSGTTVTYKWRVGGKVVATTRTLTLKKAWVGKTVKVSVIAKKSGYTSVSKTTTVVAKVRKG